MIHTILATIFGIIAIVLIWREKEKDTLKEIDGYKLSRLLKVKKKG